MTTKSDTGATNWIDSDEAPRLTSEFFERGEIRHGDQLIRRGRPKSAAPKVHVTARFDADLVAYFKEGGQGWQSRMNAALRDWIAQRLRKAG